nr:MAG: hypothetical protein [Bacteriophage sp.]
MQAKQELQIEYFFRGLVKEYRRIFKPCNTAEMREDTWKYCPHLKPNRAWERTLSEMNEHYGKAAYRTGICLPIALFAKAWLKDVLGLEGKLCGIVVTLDDSEIAIPGVFMHAVIECGNKYYDTFIPRGTDRMDLLYGMLVPGCTSELKKEHLEYDIAWAWYIFHNFILPMRQKMYPEGVVDTEFQSIFKELI